MERMVAFFWVKLRRQPKGGYGSVLGLASSLKFLDRMTEGITEKRRQEGLDFPKMGYALMIYRLLQVTCFIRR